MNYVQKNSSVVLTYHIFSKLNIVYMMKAIEYSCFIWSLFSQRNVFQTGMQYREWTIYIYTRMYMDLSGI